MTLKAITQLLTPNGGIDKQVFLASSEIILAAQAAGYELPATSWFNPASTPEHHVPGMAGQKGVAVDFMVYNNKAMGDWIADYAWKHRVRLGICWVIWYGRIRSTSPGKSGNWAAYNGASQHKDHPHINFGKLVGTNGSSKVAKVTYVPLVPVQFVWDGVSFPGADKFLIGSRGDWVTFLGHRLVKHGYTGYKEGPGPEFTEADKAGVKWFQEKQGWTGDEADGFPGPDTWKRLVASPVVLPTTPTKPVTPTKPDTAPVPEDPKPVPDVESIETVFGWNILRQTDDLPGRDRYNVRKPKIGKILRDAKASVYLLIETDQQTRKDAGAALGDEFSYWGFKYYGIFWKQSVWERRGDATNEFLFRDKNNRWLLSLPLFHKKSGKQITFDVTHLENDGDPNSDGHSARKVEVTHLVEKASKGNRVGFFDCNSTTPAIIAKPTARQNEKPRRILHNAGARFVSSLGTKLKNRAYGSHHGGKSGVKGPLIDDAWVMGDVQIVDAEIVRTDGTDASDHNAIKFRIKF